MKKLLALFLLFTFYFLLSSSAQNVGIGTNTPNASAQLDLSSTNKGFLPPRMTLAQRSAIPNPAQGLMIYCTDCGIQGGQHQYFNGTLWLDLNGNVTSPTTKTVTDIEGNTYLTAIYDTREWLAENLRTTKYSDGSSIPLIEDSTQWANNWNNATNSETTLQLPMMCWYNNDKPIYTTNKFGALYNWYAINPATNGNKNVCPTGWHVPSDADWESLFTYLGSKSLAGGTMKTTGTAYWKSPNLGATNSSVFSGLPGGARGVNGVFYNIGEGGYWWSSSDSEINGKKIPYSFYSELLYSSQAVRMRLNPFGAKTVGCSVRCVKD